MYAVFVTDYLKATTDNSDSVVTHYTMSRLFLFRELDDADWAVNLAFRSESARKACTAVAGWNDWKVEPHLDHNFRDLKWRHDDAYNKKDLDHRQVWDQYKDLIETGVVIGHLEMPDSKERHKIFVARLHEIQLDGYLRCKLFGGITVRPGEVFPFMELAEIGNI